MKISIVVPVWNLEHYLEEFLESVLASEERDFELLLVDNGSTDGTANIIESYAAKDARVQKLFCLKKGAAAARNVGLEQAKGRYVVFLDGDDTIEQNYLSLMVEAMEKENISMADCGYITQYQGEVVDKTSAKTVETEKARSFLISIFADDEHEYDGFIWNKIFLRDVIEKKHLRFREEFSFNEDRLFLTEYLMGQKDVAMISNHLYHYRVRDDSAMSATREYFASEQEMTEIPAFDEIRKATEADEELHKTVCRNMAYAQLRLFKRMVDDKQWARYRKSLLRKYARNFGKLNYQPRDKQEARLCLRYVFYGWTGISYGKRPV